MKKIFIIIPALIFISGIVYIATQSRTPMTSTGQSEKLQPGQYTPTPITSSGESISLSGAISLDEIAKHAVEGDCWTAIDSTVYDLSSYTSKHPGGPVILSMCGKDGSALFNGQHGEREKKRVESMIIGSLAK